MSTGHATRGYNCALTNCTPRRCCTTDWARFNCTQIQLSTILTEHSVRRKNWAPVICAPNRLCTSDWARFSHAQIQVSTGTIAYAVFRASGHERIQHEVTSAPPAEHDSIAHEWNWAPGRLSASTTPHRIDWARAQLCTTAAILLPIFPNLCRSHFVLYF